MTGYEPEHSFRTVLTQLDLGDADMIITPDPDAAGWAREHGYGLMSVRWRRLAWCTRSSRATALCRDVARRPRREVQSSASNALAPFCPPMRP